MRRWRCVAISILSGFLIAIVTAWGIRVWRLTSANGVSGIPVSFSLVVIDGQPYWLSQRTVSTATIVCLDPESDAEQAEGIKRADSQVVPEARVWRGTPIVSTAPSGVMAYLRRRVSADKGAFFNSYGWPWQCLRLGGFHSRGVNVERAVDEVATPWRTSYGFPITLPIRPVWRGLILNTFVFAIPLGGLMSVVSFLLRRNRHRQGRCTRCGYDMSGCMDAERCPECGAGWKGDKVKG